MGQLPTVRRQRQQYYLTFLILLCFLCAIYYTFSIYVTESVPQDTVIIHWPNLKSNLDCHYWTEGDALLSVEDPSFSPGDKAIFFHETSCRGGINSRQACAVESAARLHPHWQINLLFSSRVTKHILRYSNLAKLLEFQNVKLSRLHIKEYGKGTIMGPILTHEIKKSTHPVEHVADILRILTLHKFGGVYLDTDALLIQNLDSLATNWIAKESATDIASGVMSFSKDGVGANVTTAILKEINDTFTPDSWSYNGPKAINRVLKRICPNLLGALTNVDCGGVQILTSDYFYPIHYSWRSVYFKNGTIASMEGPYMHHMWNYLTKDLKIEKASPYDKLARKFCPTIYKMYGDQFGE